jgi:hypothetical protein
MYAEFLLSGASRPLKFASFGSVSGFEGDAVLSVTHH